MFFSFCGFQSLLKPQLIILLGPHCTPLQLQPLSQLFSSVLWNCVVVASSRSFYFVFLSVHLYMSNIGCGSSIVMFNGLIIALVFPVARQPAMVSSWFLKLVASQAAHNCQLKKATFGFKRSTSINRLGSLHASLKTNKKEPLLQFKNLFLRSHPPDFSTLTHRQFNPIQ